MLRLNGYCGDLGLGAEILLKLETFNPTGSVKFRAAKFIIERAEECGELKSGSTIIEATSGNMGIALAAVAAAKGYKAVIVMPEGTDERRVGLLRGYNAQIVFTPKVDGMRGAVLKAEQLHGETPDSFMANQFCNRNNALAHTATAREILADCNPDIFVAGVGSGGTFTGVSEYLKSKNPRLKAVAVEPSESPTLSRGISGKHRIAGIGSGFVPRILNRGIIDEIICVDAQRAADTVKLLSKAEGIWIGTSGGAAVAAATELAARSENKGKTIVTVAPDGGERSRLL